MITSDLVKFLERAIRYEEARKEECVIDVALPPVEFGQALACYHQHVGRINAYQDVLGKVNRMINGGR